MGYFLNIICDNLDNLSEEHYVNGKIPTGDERFEYVKNLLTSIGIKNIRRFYLDDGAETYCEYYYYFLTHISDLSYFTENYNHLNRDYPFTERLKGQIRSEKNLKIVLIDQFNVAKSLEFIYDRLFLPFKDVIVLNPSELDYNNINDLKSFHKKTFNIVYNKWSENYLTYYPNLFPFEKENYRYRVVTGLFYFYKMQRDIRNCTLEEVYENPNENYFYFINGDNFHNHVYDTKKIPLPQKVRECFGDCLNFHLIILNEHEYESESFLLYFNDLVQKEELDYRRIYMFNNNSKLSYYKEKYNILYNVYSLNFLVMFISTHMVELGEPKFIDEKKGDFFLCHNRSPKPHRYSFLCMLKKEGLLEKMDWSLIMGWYHKKTNSHQNPYFYGEFFIGNDIENYKNEIEYFRNIDIKKSKYEEDRTWFDDFGDNPDITWKNVYELKTYEDSYVNIITESCYSPNEVHITEKSMKPFYFYQLPIFLSSYNHVKYLKERFGFDVFNDVIDHSYDDEPDNRIRMYKVINEIKRIDNNKDEIKIFYKNNKSRFEKNHQIIHEIYNSKKDTDYMKSLMNLEIKDFLKVSKKLI